MRSARRRTNCVTKASRWLRHIRVTRPKVWKAWRRSLDRRKVGDFVDGIEQFARERPVAFLGGAMVAGFALARFMKSSSTRRDRRADRSYEPQPASNRAAASPAGATTTPGVWTPNTTSPRAGS